MDKIERQVRENFDQIRRERAIQKEIANQRTIRGEREITRTHVILVVLAVLIGGAIWLVRAIAHAPVQVKAGVGIGVLILALIIVGVVVANHRARAAEYRKAAEAWQDDDRRRHLHRIRFSAMEQDAVLPGISSKHRWSPRPYGCRSTRDSVPPQTLT